MLLIQDQHLHSFFTHCQRLENLSVAGTDSDMPTSRNKVDLISVCYVLLHDYICLNFFFQFLE